MIILHVKMIQHFNKILSSYKINATCINHANIGNYFYYDLRLNSNTRVKDIQKYSDEISLALKTSCKPIIKIIHNEGVIRLEFIKPRLSRLNLFDIIRNDNIPDGEINCLLGQSVDGKPVWMDLSKNPNMIISGTTGSGKSVLLHNIIANLFNYNDTELTLVDPKGIEFVDYKKINANVDVIHTYDETLRMLNSMISLMEIRYQDLRLSKSIKSMKNVIIIIDEFADLIMQDKNDALYNALCRLSQKCRAAKIYIILATQRPSVNIINGTIKANFLARISCRVASHIDSKVILDSIGAENLLGKGDALIRDNFRNLERFQIAYTNAAEVCSIYGN